MLHGRGRGRWQRHAAASSCGNRVASLCARQFALLGQQPACLLDGIRHVEQQTEDFLSEGTPTVCALRPESPPADGTPFQAAAR